MGMRRGLSKIHLNIDAEFLDAVNAQGTWSYSAFGYITKSARDPITKKHFRIHLHRFVFELAYGKIPDGLCIYL